MKKLIQILIVLFFAIPTFAGDTYYIDDAGSNGNGGRGVLMLGPHLHMPLGG